jgi:hypothetical protein
MDPFPSASLLPRARSIRIRRIASAAAAKKWPPLFQLWTRSVSTSRRYASCTKAVAWSVWPGFSCASLCVVVRREPGALGLFRRRAYSRLMRKPGPERRTVL